MKVLNPSTGNFEELYVKALDSMPVGTIVYYDGQASDIPIGWVSYGTGQIKKTSNTRPLTASVVNESNNSTTDTYSCDYINNKIVNTQSSSQTSAYSCNYVNNFINNLIDGAIIRCFSNTSSILITSINGYGNVFIFGASYGGIISLQGTNQRPNFQLIYGTEPAASYSIHNNQFSFSYLESWDHYIVIGTATISNIESND